MRSRPGAALLELLTSSVLLGMLAAACAALLRADAMIVLSTQQRAATEEARRIAATVISSEVSTSTRADLHTASPDSLSMRAFRGYAIVCAQSAGKTVLRYRGLRLPDQDKDSILIAGEEMTTDFRLATPPRGVCAPAAREEIVAAVPTRPLRIGAIVLFFETGAYHLSANALRYRRGGEGKQPLTDELLDTTFTSFALSSTAVRAGERTTRLLNETQ